MSYNIQLHHSNNYLTNIIYIENRKYITNERRKYLINEHRKYKKGTKYNILTAEVAKETGCRTDQ